MSFTITGLSAAEFAPLFALSDEELERRGAIRKTATSKPGFPCRVTLEDAEPGETVLEVDRMKKYYEVHDRSLKAIFSGRTTKYVKANESLNFKAHRGETVAIALDDRNLEAFRNELDKACQEKRETFVFPGCPKPVPVAWAAEALDTLGRVREDLGKDGFAEFGEGVLHVVEFEGLDDCRDELHGILLVRRRDRLLSPPDVCIDTTLHCVNQHPMYLA